jgi:hypothetical protein
VIFDRDAQSSNKNYDGTTYGTLGGTVTTGEGVWNIYRVLDSGVGDLTLANFTYGIIEESINDPATNQAANHTRLWLKYERNTSDPDDTGYKPVMLTWPVYDTKLRLPGLRAHQGDGVFGPRQPEPPLASPARGVGAPRLRRQGDDCFAHGEPDGDLIW